MSDKSQQINTPEFDALPMEEKEKIIRQRKLKFVKKMAVLVVIMAGLIAGGFVWADIRKNMIEDRRRYVVNPPADKPADVVVQPAVEEDKEYSNTTLQVSFRYPANTTLTESFDTAKGEGKVEVIYSKDNNPEFSEGYKVGITVFSTRARDLHQFSTTRFEAMKTTCPDTAVYSDVREGKMGEYASLNYTIDYCSGFYRNYYLDFGGKYFEVSRFYRGDIGYRQQYESETEEIIKTISLLPQRFDVTEYLKSATDAQSGIKFEYPSDMINDCAIPLPTDTSYRQILSMCQEGQKESGVVIGVAQRGDEIPFDSFIESEKNKMQDDYFAAKGVYTEAVAENLEFKGRPAVKLMGFSWKDTNYLFIFNTYKDRPYIIMVGYKDTTSELNTTIENIINSIDFIQ